MSPAEAARLLAAGALLVDVRTAAPRGGPAALRAVAVPWLRSSTSADAPPARSAAFADDVLFAAGAAPIVLCDAAGALSGHAAAQLAKACKNDIYLVAGGLQAWAVRLRCRTTRPPALR